MPSRPRRPGTAPPVGPTVSLDTAYRMVGPVLFGMAIGYFFIDPYFHTRPWGMLGMTFLGISTLVTLSLVGVFIQPFLDSLSPLSMAIVLVTSSVAPDVAGPYNTTVILLSERLGLSPYRISRWNWGFSLVFGGAGVGILCMGPRLENETRHAQAMQREGCCE